MIPDITGPDLRVLFVGHSVSLKTAKTGHHFHGPSNRFWRALHEGGFTPGQLSPEQDRELLQHGLGLTNLVTTRASNRADAIPKEEVKRGFRNLLRKVRKLRPRAIAILTLTVCPVSVDGPGEITTMTKAMANVNALYKREGLKPLIWWVLPNPSGRVSHYVHTIGAEFGRLHEALAHRE